MADIREEGTSLKGSSPLERAQATSSARASALNIAQMGAEKVAANIAANAARKYGVEIFGRLHNQQWDDIELAEDCARKIGGTVVEVN